jgi:hypothetical protein
MPTNSLDIDTVSKVAREAVKYSNHIESKTKRLKDSWL